MSESETSPMTVHPVDPDPPKAVGVELSLDDAFHRVKRTLLLFCGGLILLGCTDPSVAKAALGDLPSLPGHAAPANAVLRLTLWLGAVYYFWGFAHQAIAARRANRDLLDAGQLANYETQLRAFIGGFGRQAKTLETVVSSVESGWEKVVNELISRANTLGSEHGIQGMLEFSFDDQNVGWRWRIKDPAQLEQMEAERRNRIETGLLRHYTEQLQAIEKFHERFEDFRSDWAKTAELIAGMAQQAEKAAERITINRGMYRDRRIHFYGWEVTVPVVIFGVATLFTFSPLGFDLAEGVVWIAREWPWRPCHGGSGTILMSAPISGRLERDRERSSKSDQTSTVLSTRVRC